MSDKDRFFKIPIAALVKKLPPKFGFTKLNLSQQAMVDGLEDHRFWVHISARRTGKSICAAILALAKLLEPNSQVVVVAPNYTLSSIIWEYVVELIEHFQLETKRFNQKDHVIHLENNSTFRLFSANNRTSLVGRAMHLLIIDEAAIIPDDEYFTRDLRPALSTYEGSRALFITTPRGKKNYIYEYYIRGQNDDPLSDWGSGRYPWHVNPGLKQNDIDDARRTLSEALFAQEYLCDFILFEGQIYKLKEDHLQDYSKQGIIPGSNRLTFIAGLDMGFRDATAFVVCATDGTNWWVVDSYSGSEGTTDTHAQEILKFQKIYNIDSIYIDTAAQQTKVDLAYQYDIVCTNANKSVNDGIACLQVLVANGQLLFDEKARDCFESLMGYRWNPKTTEPKPIHDDNSHYADALRYAIYTYTMSSAMSITM